MAYDQYRHSVKSLLQFAGVDGSTAIVDASGKTWAAHGNAQIDADGGPFGDGALLLDGSGDYIDSAASADWNPGTSSFTVELFYKPAALSSNNETLFSTRNIGSGAATGMSILCSTAGTFALAWTSTGTTIVNLVGPAMTSGAYNHCAFCRSGNNWYLLLNGAVAAQTSATGTVGAAAGVNIGRDPSNSGPRYANGRIAQCRWTPGVARYTGAYGVPAEPFELRGSRVTGTVQKGDPASPASRNIVLIRTADLVNVGSGISDATTGDYEIETDADVGETLLGLAYPDYGQPAKRSHVYSLGERTWHGDPAPLGHWYECEQAGTTGATEPTWPTDGSTVTDGTVIWRDKGLMERPWAEGPYLAEAA